jgi:hypothetical protein
MDADGLIDLLVELSAALDIMWGKPAAHTLVLQIGVEAFRERLIQARIADKAGIELKGLPDQRFDVGI